MASNDGDTPQLQDAVFVVGPSSSGKTTLCNAFAEDVHIDPSQHIKEVARNVMKTQGFSRHTTKAYEMQHTILKAQLQAEATVLNSLSGTEPHLLLSDRSALDPIVYAATADVPDAADMRQRLLAEEALQATLPFYRRALFVVLHPIPEWIEDDGVRSLDDPLNYHSQLCELLTELGIPFIELNQSVRDLKDRVRIIKEHLQNRKEGRRIAQVSREAGYR